MCPLFWGPKTGYGLGSVGGGLPSCSCNWLDYTQQVFNVTVEIECVFKRSSNWVLHLGVVQLHLAKNWWTVFLNLRQILRLQERA